MDVSDVTVSTPNRERRDERGSQLAPLEVLRSYREVVQLMELFAKRTRGRHGQLPAATATAALARARVGEDGRARLARATGMAP
jgi:hypothetical protein